MVEVINSLKKSGDFLIILTGMILFFSQIIIHIPHLIEEGILEMILSFIPIIFSIAIAVFGFILHRNGSEKHDFIIFGFSLGILTLTTSFTSLNLFYVILRGGVLLEPKVLLINNASAGALLGLVIGYYYTQTLKEKERVKLLQSTMTHDLKNKAQILIGQLELIKEKSNFKENERIEKAKEAIYDLINLSDKIRLHQKETYKASKTTTNEIVEIIEKIKNETTEIKISLKNKIEKDTEIKAGALIQEVIEEIIKNSKIHGKAKKIFISLKETPNNIILTIEDNGEGIKSKKQEKVLEKEYTTTSASYGLGLSLSNKIIENYGGNIEIGGSKYGGVKIEIKLKKND